MSRDFSPDNTGRDLPARSDRSGAREAGNTERARSDAATPSFDLALDQAPERSQENSRLEIHFSEGQAFLHDRDRVYRLSESETRTIAELGRFRVIASHDLAQHVYAGDLDEARSENRNLVRQGLIRMGTFEGPEAIPRELLTLTIRGHRLLQANRLVAQEQAVYHGFVKPKDANHDADLYRVYQKEASRIRSEGGKNLRVVLDYELRSKINRDLARFGPAARQEIAERYGLRVVGDKIPIPDLSIEYETHEGKIESVNLELVTEHYRGRGVAEKVRAGFSLYTPHGEAQHLRCVLDQHELIADIRSL
jgi:ribosomal protein S25